MPRYKEDLDKDSSISERHPGRLGRWLKRGIMGLGLLAATTCVNPDSSEAVDVAPPPPTLDQIVLPDVFDPSGDDFLENFFTFLNPDCRLAPKFCKVDSHVDAVIRTCAGQVDYDLSVRGSRWVHEINATAGDNQVRIYQSLMQAMYWTAAGIEAKRLAIEESREFGLADYIETVVWEIRTAGTVVTKPEGLEKIDARLIDRSFHSMQAAVLGHEVSHIINGDAENQGPLHSGIYEAVDFEDYIRKAELVEKLSVYTESRADRYGLSIVLSEEETVITAKRHPVLDKDTWDAYCKDRCDEMCGWELSSEQRNAFDPVAALGLWKIIEADESLQKPKQVFRTHPDPKKRYEAVKSYVLESDWAKEHPKKELLPSIIDKLYE